MDELQLAFLNNLYQQKPHLFTSDEVDNLEQMNTDFGTPFQRNQEAGDFNLFNTVNQLAKGFIKGFSTVDLGGDKPANTVEEIASSVGHLLGFVGYIPGIGTAAKLGSMGIARAVGYAAKGLEVAKGVEKGLQASKLFTEASSGMFRIKSAPMIVADYVMKGYNKIAPSLEAVGYFKKGTMMRDVIEGGLHLGIASAAGEKPLWQLDIDDRLNAFKSGAVFGGAFRGIGAAFPSEIRVGSEAWKALPLAKRFSDPKVYARVLSASLVSGLPSTLDEQPLPLQVYEYLLGGFFGINEIAPHQRQAMDISKKYMNSFDRDVLLDPKTMTEWQTASPKVREELQLQADLELGGRINSIANNATVILSQAYKDSLDKLLSDGKINQAQYNKHFRTIKIAEDIVEMEKTGTDPDTAFNTIAERTAKRAREDKQIQEVYGDQLSPREMTTEAIYNEAMKRNMLNDTYKDLNVNPGFKRPFNSILDLTKREMVDENGEIATLGNGQKITESDLVKLMAEVRQELPAEIKYEEKIVEPSKRGRMTFGYGASKRPEIKASSTFEAIQNGERTATTRFYKDGHIDYWRDLKPGDIVEFDNGKGDKINVKVTKAPYEIDFTNKTVNGKDQAANWDNVLEQWSKLEGWSVEWVKSKTGKAIQFRYELVKPSQTSQELAGDTNLPKPIDSTTSEYLGFKELLNRISAKTGINLEEKPKDPKLAKEYMDTYRDLRQVWLNTRNAKAVRQSVVGKYGVVSRVPEIDDFGRKTEMFAPESFFSKLIDGAEIIKYHRVKGKLKGIYDYNPTPRDIPELGEMISNKRRNEIKKEWADKKIKEEYASILSLYQTRKGFYGGKKDKNNWIIGKLLVPNVAEGHKIVDDFIGTNADRLKDYKALEDRFVKLFDAKDADATAKRGIFKHLYGNNIRYIETLNNTSIETILANPKKFITSAAGLNKRNNVIDGRDTPVEKEALAGIKDAENGLNFIVLNSKNKFLPSFAEGLQDIIASEYKVDKGKESVIDKATKVHRDGVTYLRSDVFDAMGRYGGFDPETMGSLKGATTFQNGDKGFVLQKHAWHRASSELDKWMFDNNIHQIANDTSVKQMGNIKTYDAWINKDNQFELYDGNAKVEQLIPEVAPLESLRINLQTYEPDAHDVMAVKQLITNIRDPKIQSIVRREMIDKATMGDERHNNMAKDWFKLREEINNPAGDKDKTQKEIDKLTKKINVEKLGTQQILDILLNGNKDTGRMPATKLYEKVVRHIIRINDIEPVNGDDGLDSEIEEQAKTLQENRSAAQVILDNAEITPIIMNHPDVAKYFQQALKNYLVNRSIRPQMEGSMKAIAYPMDHFLQKKFDIKPGEYMLGEAAREKEIQFQGETTTLGKAWDKYQALKDKTTPEAISMMNDLTHTVIRVPADSRAGVRVLKFKGFTGVKGKGILVHPEEAINLGGMDYDIDSVFIYTSLPKGIKEYYSKPENRNQWYKEVGGKKGMIDSKDYPEFLAENKYGDLLKSPLSMFDPVSLMDVNRDAYMGNQLLGPSLTASNKLMVLQDMTKRTGGVLEFKDGYTKDKIAKKLPDWVVNFRLKVELLDDIELEKAKRAVVNYAADAADGKPLKSKDEIADILISKAFGKVYIEAENSTGKKYDLKNLEDVELSVKMTKEFDGLSKLDQAVRGKDYTTDKSLTIWDTFALVNSSNVPDDVPSAFYGAVKALGSKTLKWQTDNFVGNQYYDFVNKFVKMFNAKRSEDPEAYTIRKTILRNSLALRQDAHKNSPAYKALRKSDQLQMDRDFRIRDIEAMATSFTLYETAKEARKDHGEMSDEEFTGKLAEIAKKAEAFKIADRDRRSTLNENIKEGKYEKKDFSLSDLHAEMKTYRDSLDKSFQNWFDAYVIGTYHVQEVDIRTFKKRMELEARGDEESQAKAQDLYNKTYNSRLWLKTDFINPENIQKYLGKVNEIGQATFREVTDNTVRKILGRTLVEESSLDKPKSVLSEAIPEAESMNKAEVVREKVKEFTSKVKEYSQIDINDPKNPATQRMIRLRDYLSDFFYKHPQFLENFEGTMQGILLQENDMKFSKSLEKADLLDLEYIAKTLEGITKADGKFRRRYFFWMSEKYNSLQLPKDLQFARLNDVPIISKEGPKIGSVQIITSTIGKQYLLWNSAMLYQARENKKAEIDYARRFPIVQQLNEFNFAGVDLFDYAVAIRDKAWADAKEVEIPYINEQMERTQKLFDKKYKNKTFTVSDNKGGTRTITVDEALKEVQSGITKWAEQSSKRWYDPEGEKRYLDPYRDKKSGFIDVDKFLSKYAQMMVEERTPPNIGLEGWGKVLHQINLENMAIQKVQGKESKWVYDLGPKKFEYLKKWKDNLKSKKKDYSFLEYQPKFKTIDYNVYFPHNGHGKATVEKYFKETFEKMIAEAGGKVDVARTEIELRRKLAVQNAQDGGMVQEYISAYSIENAGKYSSVGHTLHRAGNDIIPGYDRTPEALLRYEQQFIKSYWNLSASTISRWMIQRFKKANAFGEETKAWARFMEIYNASNLGYPSIFPKEWTEDKDLKIKNNPYYMFTDEFVEKSLGKWGDKIFGGAKFDNRASIDALQNNKDVIEKQNAELTKLLKSFKIKEEDITEMLKEPSALTGMEKSFSPEQLEQIKTVLNKYEKYYEDIYQAKKELFAQKLAWFSNLEGKVELLTLLSNTKSFVNNIFGGTLHIIENVGLDMFKNAGDLSYLDKHGFIGIKGLDETMEFTQKHSSTESYITSELSFNSNLRTDNIKNFVNDVMTEFKTKKKFSDAELGVIAEKYQISPTQVLDDFSKVGAYFMRYGELKLRNRAWMAHYLQAREALEVNGFLFPKDHPWLIKLANRGVAATQFLYNNANRPMFMKTSMGKIFTRFQLWAWNSVKFRADVFREAKTLNYRQGTPQFERLQRMMTADLFMLGLGSLFPYGLFASNMPQPFQSLINLSQFMFGDEAERDKSFYSTVPFPASMIKPIAPPSFRYLDPLFIWMLDGKWDRWASNQMWTLFPFGKLGHDTYETIENPTMVLENMAGFPLHKLQQEITKDRKKNNP